jgi:hypothetical protein
MKRLLPFVALTLVLAGGLRAAELAPGLVYARPGADTRLAAGASVILDLRYVTDDTTAHALLAPLKSPADSARRVILALVSPETSARLRVQLAGLPGVLTVGATAPDFKTDITVAVSPADDRRAFDALAAGLPPEKLIVENADKPRRDESALVREHTGAAEPPSGKPAETRSAEPAKPVPVDLVLQRAVQIHRGLVALKKI